jgi:hypothetical protein
LNPLNVHYFFIAVLEAALKILLCQTRKTLNFAHNRKKSRLILVFLMIISIISAGYGYEFITRTKTTKKKNIKCYVRGKYFNQMPTNRDTNKCILNFISLSAADPGLIHGVLLRFQSLDDGWNSLPISMIGQSANYHFLKAKLPLS